MSDTSKTMRAIRYDGFGDVDVLDVRDVPRPAPGPDEVLVQLRAAGINPGEAALRSGAMAQMFPSTFPSGQGSDLAGVVVATGPGVATPAVGDEVLGWVDTRSSHAEYVVAPAVQTVPKPDAVSWSVAGGLFVAGGTAWAATRAVAPSAGETVVVSGAAGGVGSLVVQLAVERGATVLGLAGPANHDWLRSHGVVPIGYGDGVADRITAAAPNGVDAFVDTFGNGYVELALQLGVAPDRIDTIIDFAAAAKHGVRSEGSAQASNPADLGELVSRLADGRLELPIAATYPLDRVRDAYTDLEQRHTRGKIVLVP